MIEIKKVEASQLEDLRNISIDTFKRSFTLIYNEYEIESYLNDAFSLKKLQEELEDPHSAFYFSYLDGKLMGYLKINLYLNHHKREDPFATELQRIYILKNYIGKGYGSSLLKFAIERAMDLESRYIWLSTGEENTSAIEFYKRNNFEKIDEQYLNLGTSKVKSVVMMLPLILK